MKAEGPKNSSQGLPLTLSLIQLGLFCPRTSLLNQLLVNFWFYVLVFFWAQSSCGVIYNQLCTGTNPCSIGWAWRWARPLSGQAFLTQLRRRVITSNHHRNTCSVYKELCAALCFSRAGGFPPGLGIIQSSSGGFGGSSPSSPHGSVHFTFPRRGRRYQLMSAGIQIRDHAHV